MEQEHIMDRCQRVALQTGKQLLQLLAFVIHQSYKKYKEHSNHGEQNWRQFNESGYSKDMREFLEGEVNLDKVKKELKKSGVRFHFKKETDGKYQIWFESKDHVVLENAINKAINDIMKDPKKAKDELLKKPHEKTPKEQMAAIVKDQKAKGKEAVTKKTKGKAIS